MHSCRLCEDKLTHQFDLTLLGKYDVPFSKCEQCGSLQSETPYWLDEAYSGKNLSNLDTGAAQRNIHNLAACYAICKLFKIKDVIDIGGGDGLLCRMLRDYRINCFVKDKYATPIYAQGFTEQNFLKPDMIIGFEVLEHFANPRVDLEELFQFQSKALLLSTAIYDGQSKDWWYLVPESGQHVFFYSKKALEMIAKKYGYSLVMSGGFILLLKERSVVKKALAKLALSKVVCRLLRSWVVLLPAPGIQQDQALQIEQSKRLRAKE
jgi:hypothetical protein